MFDAGYSHWWDVANIEENEILSLISLVWQHILNFSLSGGSTYEESVQLSTSPCLRGPNSRNFSICQLDLVP